MSCRGIFYALSENEAHRLLSAKSDEELIELINDIGEVLDADYSQYMDKSWDALQRCLSDGTLELDAGTYPLNTCVLGGMHLYDGDDNIVCYVPPVDVQNVVREIATIDKNSLYEMYTNKPFPNYHYGVKDADDFEYTWEYFKKIVSFYQKASAANRSVVFTADQ